MLWTSKHIAINATSTSYVLHKFPFKVFNQLVYFFKIFFFYYWKKGGGVWDVKKKQFKHTIKSRENLRNTIYMVKTTTEVKKLPIWHPPNSMLQHSYVGKTAPIHDFSMLIKNQSMEWRVVLLIFIISLIWWFLIG